MVAFYTCVSRWSFSGVTASLLKSPGLFLVFWPISKCCSLDGLDLSSNFQILQPSYQTFNDRSKCTNNNWYHRHLYVPLVSKFSSKVQVLVKRFAFFDIHSVVRSDGKILNTVSSLFFPSFFFFFFLLMITKSSLLAEIRGSVCTSKSQRVLCVSFSRTDSGLCM